MNKSFSMQRRRAIQHVGAASAAIALGGCATMGAKREHFVLVHGQWHGSWCWSKVVPLLTAQGHRVTAIDLPGRGGDPKELEKLTPTDYVSAVNRVLDAAPEPVVLVGHSLGGGTISLAGEARPDKIKRLVYLTAFLVPPGKPWGPSPSAIHRQGPPKPCVAIPKLVCLTLTQRLCVKSFTKTALMQMLHWRLAL